MSENEDKPAARRDETRRIEAGHSLGEGRTVAEAWTTGRLKQAKKLLERFAAEFDEHDPRDPTLLRDYYWWTGKPHYRTEFGWSEGLPEDADEHPADVIERVNC